MSQCMPIKYDNTEERNVEFHTGEGPEPRGLSHKSKGGLSRLDATIRFAFVPSGVWKQEMWELPAGQL